MHSKQQKIEQFFLHFFFLYERLLKETRAIPGEDEGCAEKVFIWIRMNPLE